LAIDARRDPRRGLGRCSGSEISWGSIRDAAVLGTQAEIDESHRPGTTTDDAVRLHAIETMARGGYWRTA
jgi:transposase